MLAPSYPKGPPSPDPTAILFLNRTKSLILYRYPLQSVALRMLSRLQEHHDAEIEFLTNRIGALVQSVFDAAKFFLQLHECTCTQVPELARDVTVVLKEGLVSQMMRCVRQGNCCRYTL